MIVAIAYKLQIVYAKLADTHEAYDSVMIRGLQRSLDIPADVLIAETAGG